MQLLLPLLGQHSPPLWLVTTVAHRAPCLLQVVVEDYFMSNHGMAPLTVVG